jgi:large subunit ribosomal protein L31e
MSEPKSEQEPVESVPSEEETDITEEPATEAETAKPEEEERTETELAEGAEEEKPAETDLGEETEEGEAEGEEIEVVEERIYTIPLRHAWVVTPRGKRAPRVVRDVRDFVARHMKAEEVAMSNEVNAVLWARGINKPPRKIKIRAVKDKEGKVIVYPAKAS